MMEKQKCQTHKSWEKNAQVLNLQTCEMKKKADSHIWVRIKQTKKELVSLFTP